MYIFCVFPFFLSYQIYPVLTNNGGYPRSRFLAVFLFSVWSLGRDVEAQAIEKDLILNCSQVLLLDHHVGGGPSWAGLHHAGGPGVEHLLALAHHTLARAELSMARRVLSAAWSPAFSRAPVDHPTKLLARTLGGTLWWVASCLVTSLTT